MRVNGCGIALNETNIETQAFGFDEKQQILFWKKFTADFDFRHILYGHRTFDLWHLASGLVCEACSLDFV